MITLDNQLFVLKDKTHVYIVDNETGELLTSGDVSMLAYTRWAECLVMDIDIIRKDMITIYVEVEE